MERKTIEKIEETKEHTLVIEGRNAVLEAFRSGRTIDKLFVLDGCQDGPVRTIVREAKKHGTILNFVGKERLSQLTQTGRHQGVIAYAAAYDYAEIDDMLKLAEKRGEDPFLIVLDGIEDPHNLGAIIRTANIAGAHGVIIPKRRAVGLTATVAKTSAGALNYTPVAKVTNLVKTMEELGIGRPSTYAPTISLILGRRYITKEGKNLYLTEIGEVVNNIMKQSFPSIVDVHFTANMEGLLDMVEEGKVPWKEVIRNFYPDLDEAVKAAQKDLEKVKIEDEVTDVICDVCGRNMVVKYGPHGKFLACPGFPECRNTKPYLEKIGVTCPKCGKEVVLRKTKKGRKYFGCEDNPECDFMSWSRPVAEKCPKCGGYMVIKGNKIVCADEQCGYVTDRKNVEKDSE